MIRIKSLFGCGITAVFIVVATASVAQLIDTAMNAYAQNTFKQVYPVKLKWV
jgi:hypothetical protein